MKNQYKIIFVENLTNKHKISIFKENDFIIYHHDYRIYGLDYTPERFLGDTILYKGIEFAFYMHLLIMSNNCASRGYKIKEALKVLDKLYRGRPNNI